MREVAFMREMKGGWEKTSPADKVRDRFSFGYQLDNSVTTKDSMCSFRTQLPFINGNMQFSLMSMDGCLLYFWTLQQLAASLLDLLQKLFIYFIWYIQLHSASRPNITAIQLLSRNACSGIISEYDVPGIQLLCVSKYGGCTALFDCPLWKQPTAFFI